jgi:RadC-like JAB domain
MGYFVHQGRLVIFLDARYRHISTVEITKGSINESLAYPRDIFGPVIGQSALLSGSRTTIPRVWLQLRDWKVGANHVVRN